MKSIAEVVCGEMEENEEKRKSEREGGKWLLLILASTPHLPRLPNSLLPSEIIVEKLPDR